MLSISHVTRRYGDLVAVDDVTFDVPAGQMIGFLGGNGAGKTTTMRIAMGLLAADAGDVRWRGRPATAGDRRHFGYMPEERGLYPKQGIVDQLVYLARLKGQAAADARAEALALLERFGLADRGKDKLEKLSLGNQQRVQIAAAVMADPKALILDKAFVLGPSSPWASSSPCSACSTSSSPAPRRSRSRSPPLPRRGLSTASPRRCAAPRTTTRWRP